MRHLVFFKHYSFSIVVAAVIFYVSILKPAQLPSDITLFAGADKLIHLLMYLGLGLMLNFEVFRHYGLDSQSPNKKEGYSRRLRVKPAARLCRLAQPRMTLFFVLAFPILYGGIIELLQANFFPPRTGEWLDFAANTTGVLLAYLIYHKILKNRLNRK
jgi:VanZ family protein